MPTKIPAACSLPFRNLVSKVLLVNKITRANDIIEK
jgi:hypothetical protein